MDGTPARALVAMDTEGFLAQHFFFFFLHFPLFTASINDLVWYAEKLHRGLAWLCSWPCFHARTHARSGSTKGELGRMGRILPLLGSFTPLQHPSNHLQVQWRKTHREGDRGRREGGRGGCCEQMKGGDREKKREIGTVAGFALKPRLCQTCATAAAATPRCVSALAERRAHQPGEGGEGREAEATSEQRSHRDAHQRTEPCS